MTEVILSKSKSGDLIPCVDGLFLHSEYDPKIEAQKFIAQYPGNIFRSRYVMVYGLGFGYHIQEIAKHLTAKYQNDCQIVIIEPNLEIVKLFKASNMKLPKCATLMSSSNVETLFKDDDLINFMFKKPFTVRHPQSIIANTGFFKEFEFFKAPQDLKNTRTSIKNFNFRKELGIYDQADSLRNIYANMKTTDHWMDNLVQAFGSLAYDHDTKEIW